MQIWKPVAIGLAAVWLLNKFSLAGIGQNLVYNIRGLAFQGTTIIIKLGIQNPSSAGFVLNSVSGTVYIAGNQIANVSTFTPVTIMPNWETVVPLVVRVGILDVVSNALALFQGAITQKSPIRLMANVNVNDLVVPVDLTYNS